jgi:hypothetical protein
MFRVNSLHLADNILLTLGADTRRTICMNVTLVCVLAFRITKTYMKPIVELWLAAESESAEEEEEKTTE